MLAWAQAAGLQVATVAVGGCRVELHRAIAPEPAPRPDRDGRPGIYDQFDPDGLIRKVAADSGIPLSELQPAVGR